MKTTPFKLIAASFLMSSSLVFTYCSTGPDAIPEKITFLEKNTLNLEDSATTYKTEGDAHGGKYFSRADSANIYGAGMVFNIPDSVLQKNIRIKFNGWVRLGDLSSDKKYAFSLEDGAGNMLNWQQIDFRNHIAEPNKWINITDSVTIPGNLINKQGLIVKTYSYNPDGKSQLDCDDIELSFYKVEQLEVK
jgi:hypothetical protein